MFSHSKMCFLSLSLQFLLDVLGTGELLPNDAFIDFLGEIFCSLDKDLEDFCRDILFLICGFDVPNINVVSLCLLDCGLIYDSYPTSLAPSLPPSLTHSHTHTPTHRTTAVTLWHMRAEG